MYEILPKRKSFYSKAMKIFQKKRETAKRLCPFSIGMLVSEPEAPIRVPEFWHDRHSEYAEVHAHGRQAARIHTSVLCSDRSSSARIRRLH